LDIFKVEGIGHAHLHTTGITAAQVALGGPARRIIQMHVSIGTGNGTHAAGKANVGIDDNSRRQRIAGQRVNRTYCHTEGVFTLQAGAGQDSPLVHVHTDKYICGAAGTPFGFVKQARTLTVVAGNTPVEFYVHNVHDVFLYHYQFFANKIVSWAGKWKSCLKMVLIR
jgi:hypothetical protein